MLYFKHNELTQRYRVSLKTIHNWIDAAKRGKLSLTLHEQGSRTYIINNINNTIALERLAEQGKKFRNTLHHKTIKPLPEFYDLYSRRQILDIITNLNTHREIPRQYNYFDGGARNWDNWLQRLEKENAPCTLKATVELLAANNGALERLLANYERVNIIDVGVGNARPAKELLEKLLSNGKLHRYIAVDISQAMLDIARRNIQKWFGGRIAFEGHIRDIGYERFDDLIVDDMLDEKSEKTINVVLLLGSTPVNFRNFTDPLKVLCGSMGVDDILIYTCKPDTEISRRYFDFNPNSEFHTLSPSHRLIFDLLNIDSSLYEVEMGFDEQKCMRYIRIKLKTSLTIQFDCKPGKRNVYLEKGDTILLMRAWHLSAIQTISAFQSAGFALLQSSITKDRQYILTISGIDTQSE